MSTYPFYSSMAISHLSKILCHNMISKYSTTHIISMGSKLFLSVKYTFHSIYSNTSPSTKYKLHNNLFINTHLGWVYVHIPILPLHIHFPLSKILCCNTIQTIQLQILFQWDQNYFLQSNIFFTEYILIPLHPLNKLMK